MVCAAEHKDSHVPTLPVGSWPGKWLWCLAFGSSGLAVRDDELERQSCRI